MQLALDSYWFIWVWLVDRSHDIFNLHMIGIIAWAVPLFLAIIGLGLGGMAVGLLSGLGLALSTFWVQPAVPPYDLMLLQATWFLLMATLETTGLFLLIRDKISIILQKINYGRHLFFVLLCYAFVFLTGDKQWIYRFIYDDSSLYKGKSRLILIVQIAAHMALLVSPLSISGILLLIVVGHAGLSIVNLLALIFVITTGITVTSSLLVALITDRWLGKLSLWCKDYAKQPTDILAVSENKIKLTFLLLLLLLAQFLFLFINPQPNGVTKLTSIQKIFPVRFPMFFALVMLSVGALAMLYSRIKPAQILQTARFKRGIQQFFIFLGLTWLLSSLISHEKACLIELFTGIGPRGYGFYLVVGFYMLFIDLPILIWLLGPLFIEHHCTTVTLALSVVLIHSLAPISYGINRTFQTYKKSRRAI